MSTVTDVLHQKGANVHTIRADRNVLDAARAMNDHRIGSLVAIDETGAPIGIITERDILTRVVAAERSPGATTVASVMTSRMISCTPDTPLDELRALMRKERIRHVPVVTEQRLCGMVSIGDLNMVEVKVMHETIRYFEQYIYGNA